MCTLVSNCWGHSQGLQRGSLKGEVPRSLSIAGRWVNPARKPGNPSCTPVHKSVRQTVLQPWVPPCWLLLRAALARAQSPTSKPLPRGPHFPDWQQVMWLGVCWQSLWHPFLCLSFLYPWQQKHLPSASGPPCFSWGGYGGTCSALLCSVGIPDQAPSVLSYKACLFLHLPIDNCACDLTFNKDAQKENKMGRWSLFPLSTYPAPTYLCLVRCTGKVPQATAPRQHPGRIGGVINPILPSW